MSISVRRAGLFIVGAAAVAMLSPIGAGSAMAEGIPLDQPTQVSQTDDTTSVAPTATADEIRLLHCRPTGSGYARCH
ncbi:hypothetical protein ACFVUS_15870 [Nocardia sp. NPDC058058]|uniref:hypothetical protein n=1 Tax=Nocardia sp. NPDC058058 TaxID=3346317 RepID=UPI0036DF30D4